MYEDRPDPASPAAFSAPRSRYRGWRNSRPGNGSRTPFKLRLHRPPGVQHPAHQRRRCRLHAAHRHGRRAVSRRQHRGRSDGPAAGSPVVPHRKQKYEPAKDEPLIAFPWDKMTGPIYSSSAAECRNTGYGRGGKMVMNSDQRNPATGTRSRQLLEDHATGDGAGMACSGRTAGAKCSTAAPASTKSSATRRQTTTC